MLKNYLSVALRHFRTQRGATLLNVAGLALGFTCFALIAVFVTDEWSYDAHYDTADRMVRLHIEVPSEQGATKLAQSPPVWAPDMVENILAVERMTRIKPPRQQWMVSTEDRTFSEKRWAFADPQTVDMFDLNVVQGSAQQALEIPFSVMISREMARKYFGEADPLGKRLILDNQFDFTVQAVMASMPRSSHLRFDFLASYESLRDSTRLYLVNAPETQFPFSYTYFELAEGADREDVNARMEEYIASTLPPNLVAAGFNVNTELMPVRDIHLQSHLADEIEANGSPSTVWIFSAIALFVLLIACINFMNLATARSGRRAREVGLRKVLGAGRAQLVVQFLGEAMMTSFAALLVAWLTAWLVLGPFNNVMGTSYTVSALLDPALLLLLIGVAIFSGLVAGSYPAFFLSSFQPAAVLKGTHERAGGGAAHLRNALVVFQFAISIGLIIATLTVFRQMDHVSQMSLGFEKDQVATIELTDPTPVSRFPALRAALLDIPGVEGVSSGVSSPAGIQNYGRVRPIEAPQDETWPAAQYVVNFDYIETLGMEMLAGRSFSRDFPADTLGSVIINATAAREFGYASPDAAIGRELQFPGAPAGQTNRIIGVVDDFVTGSAREEVGPVIFGYTSFAFYAFVRFDPAEAQRIVPEIERIWNATVPGYVFDLRFMNDRFEALYTSETVLRKLLQYFALLTIIIACLGLFGLASYAAERRTKEVGIRRVVGGSVAGISYLLTKDLTRLVVPAFVLAAPVTWFAMDRWLDGFVFATNQSLFIYAGALVGATVVAAGTVLFQSVRAASTHPVKALRSE